MSQHRRRQQREPFEDSNRTRECHAQYAGCGALNGMKADRAGRCEDRIAKEVVGEKAPCRIKPHDWEGAEKSIIWWRHGPFRGCRHDGETGRSDAKSARLEVTWLTLICHDKYANFDYRLQCREEARVIGWRDPEATGKGYEKQRESSVNRFN